jgi:hypothetical protein
MSGRPTAHKEPWRIRTPHVDLLAREWSSTHREHAGLIIAWSLRNSQFREIVDGIRILTTVRPRQRDWKNLVLTL